MGKKLSLTAEDIFKQVKAWLDSVMPEEWDDILEHADEHKQILFDLLNQS